MNEWIDALERLGKAPKEKGDGKWMALCPAHDDRNPSLSLTEGDNGKVLVKCFGGCNFTQVRSALGLGGRRDSAPPKPPTRKRKPKEPPKEQPLPEGRNLTRWHYVDADGAIVFAVVRRDPQKQFSQWTPLDNGLWLSVGIEYGRPLYRLPDVLQSTGRIAVVEGEKCADVARKTWSNLTVTTFAGGSNAWTRTDWTPLAGREVSLLADADDVGRDAMLGIAKLLFNLGCAVSLALPEENNKEDVEDWIRDMGVAAAGQKVASLLRPYDPLTAEAPGPEAMPETPIDLPPDDAEPSSGPGLTDNPHFRLLGLEGAKIVIRLKAAGVVEKRSREQMTQPSVLISLAPEVWWCSLTGADQLSARISRSIGDSIIRIADSIGQIDTTRVVGRGAVRMADGSIAYHLGDRLWSNGKAHGLDWGTDFIWLAEPAVALAKPATDEQMRAAATAFMSYRFATEMDAKRILGWIVAALLGGALEWRPHISLVAASTTGKSWLIRHIQNIMGPLAMRLADASPAAIARLTAHTSLPVLIDEAEPTSRWVMDTLSLLRVSAGADGMRVRADQGADGVSRQNARFCALLSSTASPRLGKADSSRLTPVRLGAAVEDWPAVQAAIETAMKNADRIRARIVMAAQEVVHKADALSSEFEKLGIDSRESRASAALTAGWHLWGVDEKDVFSADNVPGTETQDAGDLIGDVLSLRFRQGGEDVSVADLLNKNAATAAQLYGIKEWSGGIAIAPTHRGLLSALKSTSHATVDLRSMLLQLPGTRPTDSALRFGSMRARAVVIPRATLDELGIDLGSGEDSEEPFPVTPP